MVELKKALKTHPILFLFGSAATIMRFGTYFLCLFFLAIHPMLMAQQVHDRLIFERIYSGNVRIEKGLSQNTVNTILQDSDGFMWFGTWDGLNRYDGYNFLFYNKRNGLSNETIRALFYRNDSLWIGTEDGLNILNRSNGEIVSYYHQPDDTTTISSNWINHIFEDHLGTILISTSSGLSAYRASENKFSRVISRDNGNPLRSNYINMTTQDSDNNYWVATNYGLVQYEKKNQTLTRFYHIDTDFKSLPDNHVNTLAIDKQGRLWVGTKAGLCFFQEETRSFKRIDNQGKLKSEIAAIFVNGDDGLWLGTNGNGLYYYNFNDSTFVHFAHIDNKAYSISDNRIYSLYSDHFQNLWIGTFNGLNKLDAGSPRFRLYRSQPKLTNSLSDNSVWSFLEVEPGKIWIGTDQGITITDRRNNTFEYILPREKDEGNLSLNLVRSIFKDSKGVFWIGLRNNGLTRYNRDENSFKHFEPNRRNPHALPGAYVTDIQEDPFGRIWVATDEGLAQLQQNQQAFKTYRQNDTVANSLPGNRIYDLFIDSKDRFWIATASGLALYNYTEDHFTTIHSNDPDKDLYTAGGDKLFSITEHRDGSLWLGTRGEGLLRYDPESGIFNRFTEQDGLPNNVTYKALEDRDGIIWITTNWGLSRFNLEDSGFSNYDATDGLQSNEFNLNASIITSSGEILVGGMNGYNAFYPEDIQVDTTPPPVRITAFKKFNVLQKQDINDGDTIRLKFDENYFAFEFASLDFTNPYKNKYRFILENYNNSWIERDASQRFAEFAKVGPGTYTFRLIASNSDGYWNLKGVNLTIIISPAWYEVWWFRLLIALLIILLIYSLIVLRMNVLRKKHEIEKQYLAFEKQMHQLEQKALQLQMNPHFLFNSLNSIQSFILNNDIENAIHYLSRFSQLMRRILSNSSESTVTLHDELQAIRLYIEIESLRFHERFTYKIEVDREIDEGFIEIPPMILQPYVENAILHGLLHSSNKGHLLVSVSQENENLLCIIQDDGIGRERATQIRKESGIARLPLGMLITKERLELLNQYTGNIFEVNVIDLYDEASQPAGTRVEIRIHFND